MNDKLIIIRKDTKEIEIIGHVKMSEEYKNSKIK